MAPAAAVLLAPKVPQLPVDRRCMYHGTCLGMDFSHHYEPRMAPNATNQSGAASEDQRTQHTTPASSAKEVVKHSPRHRQRHLFCTF